MTPWLITLFGITLAIPLSTCGRTDDGIQQRKVCTTQECHQVADAFQASMNKSLDPCVNFYHYVCGRWESANPKPKYVKAWSSIARYSMLAKTRLRDELQSEPSSEDIPPIQKMKKFYKSCMNEETRELEGLNRINEILKDTKGWPMIMNVNEWDENAMPWQDVDDYYQSLLGDSVFYHISTVTVAEKQDYFLAIYSPTFYPDKYKKNSDYRALIRNTAQAFIQQNNATVSYEQLEADIVDLMELEDDLHEISSSSSDIGSVIDLDSFIREWNKRTEYSARSRINWEEVFQRIFAITSLRPSRSTPVVFQNIAYFIEFANILQSTDKRIIVNFIQWKFLSMVIQDTTKRMEDIFNEIRNEPLGIKEKPRWLSCVERLGVNYASYYLFIKKYYRLDSWNAAQNVFSTVAETYKTLVLNSNWMSRKAKTKISRKLDSISVFLGYSTFYDNEKNIIDYYEGMTIGDNYFDNILEFIRHSWKSRIKYWGKHRENEEDFDDPLVARAEYWPECNSLVMTPAILQSPLIDGTLPYYITYGTLGSAMGHEISHALNYADLREMLGTEEQKTFEEVIECFIGLFKTYFSIAPVNDGSPVCSDPLMRAQFTLDENLADWRGIEAGLRAYKKMEDEEKRNGELKLPGFEEYTDDQMFFISWAQMWCGVKDDDPEDCHSPHYIRVLATLSHSVDFAETFNCPTNYSMNPQQKCTFWTK